MSADLCLISTFGWYTETAIVEELTPISTFGWYFSPIVGVGTSDIVTVGFCLTRTLDIQLTR